MQPPRISSYQFTSLVLLLFFISTTPLLQATSPEPSTSKFATAFEWSILNYTWPTNAAYRNAIKSKKYIPENNSMIGLKFYGNKMYLAIPRLRPGVPVTLASVPIDNQNKTGTIIRNLLLEPFPSWNMNVKASCKTLQNVQSMEIDRNGIMWVLDGTRINNLTKCPPKILFFDLTNKNKLIGKYTFSPEICLTEGGYLNDIVIDETDGGYAYITDNSRIDPGLIVFSRQSNRAWKLRDPSMFAEANATNFSVNGIYFGSLSPIDGIALAPPYTNLDEDRFVYYSSLSGFNLYAISTKILRDEKACKSEQWRSNVKYIATKSTVADGMLVDNKGFLYFGMLQTNNVGVWNIEEDFSTATEEIVDPNDVIWPDCFAMDDNGFLYVLYDDIIKYFNPNYPLKVDDTVKFRILKTYTGNKNYMYAP